MLAGDLVGGARPDVVGAEQIEGLGSLLLLHPIEPRDDLLGGLLAGVDDVLRLFEAFIECRIIEHAVVLLEHRQHRLARRRGPAAHHRRAFVVDQELLCLLGEGRPVAGAILLDELDLAPEHAALRVDLLDGELFVFDRAGLRDRHRAGDRMKDADGDLRVGHRQAGGVDLGGRELLSQRVRRQQGGRRKGGAPNQKFSSERRLKVDRRLL